ncbi:MAG: hypothetical protein ACJ75J_06265 [Cytophagaceae bacterium]
MKKIIILSLILLCGFSVFAGGIEKKAKQISSNMEKALGLTKEQTSEIYNLTVKRLEAQLAFEGKTDAESKQKFTQGRRDYHAEIGKQLKTEQYNKWMEIRKEQLKLRKEGKPVKDPVIDDSLEYLNG